MDLTDGGSPELDDLLTEMALQPSPEVLAEPVWGLSGVPHRLGLVAFGASGTLTKLHLYAGDHLCATLWDQYQLPRGAHRHAHFHIFKQPLLADVEPPPRTDQLVELYLDGARARVLWLARDPLGLIWNTEDPSKRPTGEPALRPLRDWLAIA